MFTARPPTPGDNPITVNADVSVKRLPPQPPSPTGVVLPRIPEPTSPPAFPEAETRLRRAGTRLSGILPSRVGSRAHHSGRQDPGSPRPSGRFGRGRR